MGHLKDHVKSSHLNVKKKCFRTIDECNQRFISLLDLARHVMSEHDRINGRIPCPACERTFPQRKDVFLHIKTTHLNMKTKCNLCGAEVAEGGLGNHMKVMHTSDRATKPFKCND